jgi:Family of unknown function (DUF6455)
MFMAAPAILEHRPIQLHEMMARLGIEPSGSILPRLSLRYATAIHRCEVCTHKEACRDWLDHSTGSVGIPQHFCPDADILFELQFDQPGSPLSTSKPSA